MSLLTRLVAVILCAPFLSVNSSEEIRLLKEVADQYSPSMVVAFLHERIRVNKQTIESVERNLTRLDGLSRGALDLAAKSLSILDHQLTVLEEADYFDHNGTERIKNFIDQFTTNIEVFPMQMDSHEQGGPKTRYTMDQLLSSLNVKSIEVLINQTQELIATYITDLEDKENNETSNRVQKLSATLTKTKLQQLADHRYIELQRSSRCDHDYYYRRENDYECNAVDTRQNDIEQVLKQLKSIVNLFYDKFPQLGDRNNTQTATKNLKIVIKKRTETPKPPMNLTSSVTISPFNLVPVTKRKPQDLGWMVTHTYPLTQATTGHELEPAVGDDY